MLCCVVRCVCCVVYVPVHITLASCLYTILTIWLSDLYVFCLGL